eukprot:131681-Chlamydomonas_euryale.AAC.1
MLHMGSRDRKVRPADTCIWGAGVGRPAVLPPAHAAAPVWPPMRARGARPCLAGRDLREPRALQPPDRAAAAGDGRGDADRRRRAQRPQGMWHPCVEPCVCGTLVCGTLVCGTLCVELCVWNPCVSPALRAQAAQDVSQWPRLGWSARLGSSKTLPAAAQHLLQQRIAPCTQSSTVRLRAPLRPVQALPSMVCVHAQPATPLG